MNHACPVDASAVRNRMVARRPYMLDQNETRDMLNAIDVANRLLWAAWGTRTGDLRKAWQRQSALLAAPNFGPDGITWGWWAWVMAWDPYVGESMPVRVWSESWKDAIEEALGQALTL
jgi:hypothetical protein